MKLIRKTRVEKIKNYYIYYGDFLCEYCQNIVERQLSNGKRDKSCGCVKGELVSKSNKGKKRTEDQIRKNSEVHVGLQIGEKNGMYGKKGKDSPNFGKKRTEAQKKKYSEAKKGKKLTSIAIEKIKEARSKQIFSVESNIKKSEKMKRNWSNPIFKEMMIENNKMLQGGENHYNWKNGKSFEEYGIEFNKPLKQSILERDNYTCQDPNCEHKSTKLDCHHIDFNKKNNMSENLITLCTSCHVKTNYKRVYFTEYYQNIMMGKLMECLL